MDKGLRQIILESSGKAIIESMKRLMISQGVKPNARVIKSLKYKVTKNGVEILSEEWAKYIDSGRKAGIKKVPIRALLKWISKNNISPKSGMSKVGLAWAIQSAIFKRGIRARPFIQQSLETGSIIVEELIDKTMEKEIEDIIK
jgi:hypothetical protein